MAMALKNAVLCTALACLVVPTDAQTIIRQPVGSVGNEGQADPLSMDFEVSSLNTGSQVVAIRRDTDFITDGAFKRNAVFASLGLDSSKYAVLEQIDQLGSILYTLTLGRPARVDTAQFTFAICGRNLNGSCNENNVELESNTVSFIVNYVPGVAYPNCTTDDGQFGNMGGEDQFVFRGRPTVLSCQSEIGMPPVRLDWDRNGVGVGSRTTDEGEFRYARYTFTPDLGDEGAVFACRMTRPGADLNRNCVLDLNVVSVPSATITYEDTEGYVVTGSTVVFTCSATTETSTVNETAWILPEELRNTTDRYTISGDQFTLISVELGDDGVSIACTVLDNEGMEGSTAVVLKTMDAADLPTEPVTLTAAATDTEGEVSEPPSSEPPGDYTAVIIGSLFAGMFLIILVGLVISWYWRKRQTKKPRLTVHLKAKAAAAAQPRVERSPQKPKNLKAHINSSFEKERQLTSVNDECPVGYNDPDVVPRGSHVGSPVRAESLERQAAASPSRRYGHDTISLEDRIPSPGHKYRCDADYDRPRDGYDDAAFIDSGYPDDRSQQDAETGEKRYRDPYRCDADDDPPLDAERYDDGNRHYENLRYKGGYDQGSYDDEYDEENSRDGRYDDRHGDYTDRDRPSEVDQYDYDNHGYDDGPYPNNDDEYAPGDSYDRRYDDLYGDYEKPDYEQKDRRGSDLYPPSRDGEGSYGRRTSSEFSEEQDSNVPSYGRDSPTRDDRYDYDAGIYTLQDDDYYGDPSYV